MFCIKCGKELPDGVKFCPYCGAEVPKAEPTIDLTENTATKVPGKPEVDAGGMQPFGRTNMPTYGTEPTGDLNPYGSVGGQGGQPAGGQEERPKYPWEVYEERRSAEKAESAGSDDEEGDSRKDK